ncbi:hypothetical protein GCM10022393_23880 [Aquimarina addita]|uniref:Glycerophosphoryl diester phosphodiesterase membrane domain-containing protein n=1 Tax=Aquimarina addita TaxID=870485 RepID=A0ABP6UK14_9FLAO
MNNTDANQLFKKIENSKAVDFGDIFTKSIELFKKVWVQGFVHLLITFAAAIPLLLIIYIPLFAMLGMEGLENDFDGSPHPIEELSIGFLILFVLLVIVVMIGMMMLQFAVTAHFYRVCYQVDMEEPGNSGYFMFFNKQYFVKTFVLSISMVGISLLAILLCVFPLYYVMVPMQLLWVIFAFNPDLSASDLIKASFKYGNKIWLIAFGLIFISSMLAQFAGLILCYVGLFFTASFARIPVYFLYKDGLGFESEDSLDEKELFIE